MNHSIGKTEVTVIKRDGIETIDSIGVYIRELICLGRNTFKIRISGRFLLKNKTKERE